MKNTARGVFLFFLIFVLAAGHPPAGRAAAQAAAASVSGEKSSFRFAEPQAINSSASSGAPFTLYLPLIEKKALSLPGGGIDWQPSFPIRAAFYYPWFPEAWNQGGIYPYTNYNPSLGFYDGRDTDLISQHLDMMEYAHIDAGIASWWGQGSHTDAKIASLLSASADTLFRWALYYENESTGNPTSTQIRADLAYIRDHYGSHPNYLRVDGKFVVFVYADMTDGCGMADRWKQANTVGAYIVLKVFPGFGQCASQPESWHQYCPAEAADQQGSTSYTISPGFWLKGNVIRLGRDINRWTQNVRDMVASGAKWQLVTTFNEWGEGTAVEPAAEWSSSSGYGEYLEALHTNGGDTTP